MARRIGPVKTPGSPFCSQIQKWVSSSRGTRPSPVIAGFRKPLFAGWAHNVAEDLHCALHPSENGGRFFVQRNQPRYGLAALGDYDFLAALLDLIQQVQALRLEFAGPDLVLR